MERIDFILDFLRITYLWLRGAWAMRPTSARCDYCGRRFWGWGERGAASGVFCSAECCDLDTEIPF